MGSLYFRRSSARLEPDDAAQRPMSERPSERQLQSITGDPGKFVASTFKT